MSFFDFILKTINDNIRHLLGYYDYYQGNTVALTDAAIQINFPDERMVRKFRLGDNGQGIEIVIDPIPDIKIEHHKFNQFVSCDYYQVTIDNHNDQKPDDLLHCVRHMQSIPCLKILEQPVIRQRQYVAQDSPFTNNIAGIQPARALLIIEFNTYL